VFVGEDMSGVNYWSEFRKEGNGNGSFGHVWLADAFQLPNRYSFSTTQSKKILITSLQEN
jgi:hypothetical protein